MGGSQSGLKAYKKERKPVASGKFGTVFRATQKDKSEFLSLQLRAALKHPSHLILTPKTLLSFTAEPDDKHYQVAIKCIDKSQLKLEGIDIEKEVAHMREVSIISFPLAAATCLLLSLSFLEPGFATQPYLTAYRLDTATA